MVLRGKIRKKKFFFELFIFIYNYNYYVCFIVLIMRVGVIGYITGSCSDDWRFNSFARIRRKKLKSKQKKLKTFS